MKIKNFFYILLKKILRKPLIDTPKKAEPAPQNRKTGDAITADCCILMSLTQNKTYLIPYERHAPQYTAQYLKSHGITCGILIPTNAHEACNRYTTPEFISQGHFQIPPQLISIN